MTGKAGAPLTEAMFYVLMALRRGELCGTEIAAWTERCTEERVRLGPGTLYTILGRFLEEGFIQETSVQGRQRNYRLTEKSGFIFPAATSMQPCAFPAGAESFL